MKSMDERLADALLGDDKDDETRIAALVALLYEREMEWLREVGYPIEEED